MNYLNRLRVLSRTRHSGERHSKDIVARFNGEIISVLETRKKGRHLHIWIPSKGEAPWVNKNRVIYSLE